MLLSPHGQHRESPKFMLESHTFGSFLISGTLNAANVDALADLEALGPGGATRDNQVEDARDASPGAKGLLGARAMFLPQDPNYFIGLIECDYHCYIRTIERKS